MTSAEGHSFATALQHLLQTTVPQQGEATGLPFAARCALVSGQWRATARPNIFFRELAGPVAQPSSSFPVMTGMRGNGSIAVWLLVTKSGPGNAPHVHRGEPGCALSVV